MTREEAGRLAARCAGRLVLELHERCGVVLDEDAKAVVYDAVADELAKPVVPGWAREAYRRGLRPD